MNKTSNKLFNLLLLGALLLSSMQSCAQFVPDEWVIPARGNSYVTKVEADHSEVVAELEEKVVKAAEPLATVGRGGLILKNDTQSFSTTYIYIAEKSEPELSLNMVGRANFEVTCGTDTFQASIDSKKLERVKIGKLHVDSAGYIKLVLRMRSMDGHSYIVLRDVVLSELNMKPLFIQKNFDTHFGLRGPSVHLHYKQKPYLPADWIYGEVTVPEEGDMVGSYYCALAFDGGYYGFQHNTETERKVLFSIWNSEDADNSRDVSPDHRATLLTKGEASQIGDFGNEGSRLQCFLPYDWQPGKTYGFLLHAQNTDGKYTDFSAFFYDKEADTWTPLAKMRRPFTDFTLMGIYSFVENFMPEMGDKSREAFFSNYWIHSSKKQEWHQLSEARFSNDDTGRRGTRVDFAAGVEGSHFYMKMGGYFGNGMLMNRSLEVPEANTAQKEEMTNWLNQLIQTIDN